MTTWPVNHCGMPRGTQQVPLKGDITVMTYNPGSIHKRPYCRQLFNRNGNSYGSGFVVVYMSRHKYINCWISAHNKVSSPNWLEWLFCVAGAGQYAYEMLHDKQFVAKTIWGGIQSGSWESLLWLNKFTRVREHVWDWLVSICGENLLRNLPMRSNYEKSGRDNVA